MWHWLLVILLIGVGAYVFSNVKKEGCSSCPNKNYTDSL